MQLHTDQFEIRAWLVGMGQEGATKWHVELWQNEVRVVRCQHESAYMAISRAIGHYERRYAIGVRKIAARLRELGLIPEN